MPRKLVRAFTALVVALATSAVADGEDKKRDIAAIENDLVADAPAVRAKAAAELANRFPDGAASVSMLVDLLDDEDKAVADAAATSIDAMAVAGTAPLVAYFAVESRWKSDPALAESLAALFGRKSATPLDAIDWEREQKKQPMTPSEAALAAVLAHDADSPAAHRLVPAAKGSGPAKTLAAAALAMHAADILAARGIELPAHASRTAAGAAVLPLAKHATDVRAWIGARLLARVRSSDAAVIEALTQTLAGTKTPLAYKDKTFETHSQPAACIALGLLGPPADVAAPKLVDLASRNETSISTVYAAVDALLRLGKEADVVALVQQPTPTTKLLESALADHQRAAEVIVPRLIARFEATGGAEGELELRSYGRAARAALPALKKPEPREELAILRQADVLLAISPHDPDAEVWLGQIVESRDGQTAWRARSVADARLPGTDAVAAKIREWLAKTGPNRPTAGEFCKVLGRCGPYARFAVGALVAEFADVEKTRAEPGSGPESHLLRRELCRTLGLIGPGAADAIAALTTLRDKGDETIRVVAAQAIRRINAKK